LEDLDASGRSETMPLTASKISESIYDNRRTDFLQNLECQMKGVWSEYMSCVDKNGFGEEARKLREKYFSLYRCYRHNKTWKSAIDR
jgi:hypothetical protein